MADYANSHLASARTRSHLRAHYERIVSRPGRFYQQPPWVPYYWESSGNDSVELVEITQSFNVVPDDVAIFQELEGVEYIYLLQDEEGYIIEVDPDLEWDSDLIDDVLHEEDDDSDVYEEDF